MTVGFETLPEDCVYEIMHQMECVDSRRALAKVNDVAYEAFRRHDGARYTDNVWFMLINGFDDRAVKAMEEIKSDEDYDAHWWQETYRHALGGANLNSIKWIASSGKVVWTDVYQWLDHVWNGVKGMSQEEMEELKVSVMQCINEGRKARGERRKRKRV